MKKKVFSILVIVLAMANLNSCKEERKVILPNSVTVDENSFKTIETHFSVIIASNINGAITLCGDINERAAHWKSLVYNTSAIVIDIDTVVVDFEDGRYYLSAKNAHSQITARIQLVLDGGNLYERSYDMLSSQSGQSCTCSGCTATGPEHSGECDPKGDENGWYCTDCSQGTCTKSVTAGDGGFLSTY